MTGGGVKEKLEILVAVMAAIGGIASLLSSLPVYAYVPMFVLALILLIYYIFKKRDEHNFRVKWQEITISILDNRGDSALYSNISMLEALKKNAQKFQYSIFTEGEIQEIKTETGVINDIKREIGRTDIHTSLKQPLKVGEEFKHILSCRLLNTFTNEKEFWESTRYTPGTKVVITIFFPHDRICKDYKALKKTGAKTEKCDEQPILTIRDNKPCLIFQIKQVKFLETFRIEWSW